MSDQPQHTGSQWADHLGRRTASLVILAALVMAATGYFVEMGRAPTAEDRPEPRPPAAAGSVPLAVSYAEMRGRPNGPNAAWINTIEKLATPQPTPLTPGLFNPTDKLRAMADRAKGRAFAGAPPVVPHPIDQRSAASCLVCHGEGKKIGDRIARQISHDAYANCVQCHVESSHQVLSDARDPDNSFVGVVIASGGRRAWPGAPPTIPHTMWMRQACNSCHGVYGAAGLRTTHPWRGSCTQCHASSASLDQRAFLPNRLPGGAGARP